MKTERFHRLSRRDAALANPELATPLASSGVAGTRDVSLPLRLHGRNSQQNAQK